MKPSKFSLNPSASLLRKLIGKDLSNFKDIPIIINNYNRLTTLKQLISDLEKRGYHNIHIIDNLSKFQPLLDFYKKTPHKVYLLKNNRGYKALWKSKLWFKFMFGYFVYTDSDIRLVPECPDNLIEYFFCVLMKYPNVYKVGFSLKIDDLPNHYSMKNKVIKWEKQFYQNEIDENLYIAPIDTTFALYRPFSRKGEANGKHLMIRTNFPYQSRHMPWYVDSENLTPEDKFYNETTKISNWAEKL